MQAKRQPKTVSVKQPAWEEWVSRDGTAATRSADPVLMREAIANLAYSYWEARGGQDGSAEEDWLRAEGEIQEKAAAH